MTTPMVAQKVSHHVYSDGLGVVNFADRMNSLRFNLSRRGGVPLKRDGEINR
jgi:hypothetical protein